MSIEQILEDFDLIDDWEDKYRYIIELGRELPPMDEALHTDSNKVHGCVSQVWLHTQIEQGENGAPVLNFTGDSDAHIVRGLVAIILQVYSGKPADEIIAIDGLGTLKTIGLQDHLTPQRSNGLASMVKRIQDEARAAMS